MLQVTTDSQVTEVSYHTVESNFTWVIKNPAELSNAITSKKVQIPSVDVEWSLRLSGFTLQFDINIKNDERRLFQKHPHSKDDQYSFEFTFNGVQLASKGYFPLDNKKCGYYSLSGVNLQSSNTESAKAITFDPLDSSVVHDCILWTIEAKVTIRTSRKLTTPEDKLKRLNVDFETLSDSETSDFTIIVKSKEFKVHKSILSKRGYEFMKLISSNIKDNQVVINDVEPSTFEKFLVFIYCGNFPEDIDYYPMNLFALADKYEMEDLKIICKKHISRNLAKDNAMSVLKFGNLNSTEHDLKRMSLQIIKEKLQESFDKETLEELFKNETYEAIMI